MKRILFLIVATAAIIAQSSCQNKAKAEPAPFVAEQTEVDQTSAKVRTIAADLKGQQIFEAIKANYPDQVVLIDLWATWCPPCRAAMKEIDLIKKDLMERGVVFVYLTGETSPLKNWQEMIPTIDGEHYRLPKAQWQNLCESMNIPGIPAYIIFNKDGSVAYSNLTEGGYPGNDVIQNNLEVALSK
ncbi:MAG: redoxin family protein [Alloprevotella sp.]|nr:redoxin family protein [Alloprevotella sp.]